MQYAPLAAWADFMRDLPGTLVSRQYDASAEEIAALESSSGRKIFVPPALDQKNELDRTCAMLSALDVRGQRAHRRVLAGRGRGRDERSKFFTTQAGPASARLTSPSRRPALLSMPQTRGDWADAFAKAAALIARL